MQKALAASYDLKIAQIDIQINQTDIKAARSVYYPNIRVVFNTEYLKGLQNSMMPVTAIGNTVIPTGTRFQNSTGISIQQNLIDFGSRKRKVAMAQQATNAQQASYLQALRDLRIKLIDLYTEALINYKFLKANESLLQLAQKGYQFKKRLYQAGTTSNVDVADEAIQVAQALDNIQFYKDQLSQNLENLSSYTQEHYDIQNTDLSNMEDEPAPESLHIELEKTPEVHMYDALIAQKQNEIDYLKRQYLPQVSAYSYYNFYGVDPHQWSRSIDNLSQRTISLGLSIAMPVFDGFKNQAAIEKARLEKQKLTLQKLNTILQLQHQANLYHTQIEDYSIQLQTKATILNKAQDKLTMVKRLSDQQLIDQTEPVKEHMERIKRQVEVEKSIIQGISAIKKLRILSGG